MSTDRSPFNGPVFDIAIIGGGVVGCAVARRATLEGARVVLLEAAADILAGASKANSAILHSGFDAPEGSLELALMQHGHEEYLAIRHDLNLPLLETGALVVAWTDNDASRLAAIQEQGSRNGVGGLALLSPREVAEREPPLAPVRAALWVPSECVIDPWSAPLAYLKQAVANGALFLPCAPLQTAAFDGATWNLATAAGRILAHNVVNCAGLQGDIVDRMLTGTARFSIRPRKGQFVVFDKAAAALLKTIILPIPSKRTKGVVLCPTVFGNLLVGPTAEDQGDRERAPVDREALVALIETARRMLPAITHIPVTATYAGLRPASEEAGYRLFTNRDKNLVTVGAIRSTGLTSALGIARHVWTELQLGSQHQPIAVPLHPAVPNLAEHRERDWQAKDRGEIICHCEMVTRREILQALEGPIPARDIGGLKRRTRATMGRCQGFHCLAAIAKLTHGRLEPPLAVGELGHG
jgi:glycerol-3-phosphate dehydrogenase